MTSEKDTNANPGSYRVDLDEPLKNVAEIRLLDYNISLPPSVVKGDNPTIYLTVNDFARVSHQNREISNIFYAIPFNKLAETSLRTVSFAPHNKHINSITISLHVYDSTNQKMVLLNAIETTTVYHHSFLFKVTSYDQTN